MGAAVHRPLSHQDRQSWADHGALCPRGRLAGKSGAIATSDNHCHLQNGHCATFVEGFLAGAGASHMGLTFSIRSNGVPNRFIDGTAAFKAAASETAIADWSRF